VSAKRLGIEIHAIDAERARVIASVYVVPERILEELDLLCVRVVGERQLDLGTVANGDSMSESSTTGKR